MELNGALSNPRLQVELSSLTRLLRRLTPEQLTATTFRRVLGARQGGVLSAVSLVLQCSQVPMRARDTWRAAEEALGGAPIPKSSAYEALSTHAREGDGSPNGNAAAGRRQTGSRFSTNTSGRNC